MAIVEQIEKQGLKSDVLDRVDFYRLAATGMLDQERVADMGQVMTPAPVARFMASLFDHKVPEEINLLDAGAGVGSLSAAFVEEMCLRRRKTKQINITAYELETTLFEYLNTTLSECQIAANTAGIDFCGDIRKKDFIKEGVRILEDSLFSEKEPHECFTHAILNPPYRKIKSDSTYRSLLRRVGVETGNLYTGFVALAVNLLEQEGEIVAIVPRSFCNGPYFKRFRKLLLDETRLCNIHVFDSRNETFKDDNVLQENIIFHAIKNNRSTQVEISSSYGPSFDSRTTRRVDSSKIVRPDDTDMVIHIATNELDQHVVDRMNCFRNSLKDLSVDVSTGRVVDFRSASHLRYNPEPGDIPLVYPMHLNKSFVRWPKICARKPNSIVRTKETESLLLPKGCYVVVRRFSPKEEYHRIVAALYDPKMVNAPYVGFENHLNVYHHNNGGLDEELAKGLVVYLNSSLIDIYFRQFNGHTQVNATDLRMLRYPSADALKKIGSKIDEFFPSQQEIDQIIEGEVHKMGDIDTPDPVKVKKRISEALSILRKIGLPKGQQNERSALTLLALLNLKPKTHWKKAESRMIGITPIMDFCKKYYGREYAPNTRETFRRQTMHQFLAAGIVIENPDRPDRPINSPKWCYKIESKKTLKLLRTYRTKAWKEQLEKYLDEVETLKDRYALKRKMKMIPVVIPGGKKIELTPGKHNELLGKIIVEFGPRFAPNGRVLYVGDTGDKWALVEKKELEALGINIGTRGKMPDAILSYPKKGWIFIFEAVTSHGPIDSKRKDELEKLFEKIKDRIVYVTAFLTRSEMARYIGDISWETEVWAADAPDHLIHFNGIRFLGPYGNKESQ